MDIVAAAKNAGNRWFVAQKNLGFIHWPGVEMCRTDDFGGWLWWWTSSSAELRFIQLRVQLRAVSFRGWDSARKGPAVANSL